MKKQTCGIEKINYLEIHSYIPLKIDTGFDIKTLYYKIQESKIIINEKFEKNITDIFFTKMKENDNETGEIAGNKIEINLLGDYEKNENLEISSLLSPIIEVDDELKISIISDLQREINFRSYLVSDEYNLLKRIHGSLYTENQQRFFLLPIKLLLKNGQEFWTIPQLIVFSNSFAFIKYEIPMNQVESELLKENEIENEIDSIKLIDGYRVMEFKELDEITDFFKTQLCKELKAKTFILGKEFKNIIIIDYENMPQSLNDLSDEVIEDIFFILSAPVPNRNEILYLDEARNFYDRQSCGRENIKFVLKTNGGCLTMISKKQLESYISDYEQCEDVISCEKKLAIMLNANCEYAIILNILEEMNNKAYLIDRLVEGKNRKSNYIKYNRNIILINQMIEISYGSAIEQVYDFKSRMPLYHNVEQYDKKSQAIDKIINMENSIAELHFQKIISIMGIFFVVVFGLPTINNSLICIKKSFFESMDVIPCIDLNQLSVCLWGLLILSMCAFFGKYIKNES